MFGLKIISVSLFDKIIEFNESKDKLILALENEVDIGGKYIKLLKDEIEILKCKQEHSNDKRTQD